MPLARSLFSSTSRAGFTLVELLSVIAIVGVLSGITFAVTRAVGERGKVTRAQAELAEIASALEEYRRYFGDYPRTLSAPGETAVRDDEINPNAPGFVARSTDRAYNLFRALTGLRSPDGQPHQRKVSLTTSVVKYARPFIDYRKFTLERTDKARHAPLNRELLPETNTSASAPDLDDYDNALIDPWGNRYIYLYKNVNAVDARRWKRDGFLLFSAGPDGQVKFLTGTQPALTGDLLDLGTSAAARVNDDNIYARP